MGFSISFPHWIEEHISFSQLLHTSKDVEPHKINGVFLIYLQYSFLDPFILLIVMLNEDSFVLLFFSKIKNNEGTHIFESKIISESF
jgi:hypothetical protein